MMKKMNVIKTVLLAVLLMFWIAVPQGLSGVLTPSLSVDRLLKAKAKFDDPRPLHVDLNWKKLTTPEWVQKLTVDEEASKKAWAEAVGFKAPDTVGKIAPEIQPGVYNYTDKDKNPGLKELMIPYHYEKFALPAPPFPGNYRQIKVIPTRQYYWGLPFSQLTLKNQGDTKQDGQGYILWKSYVGGIPWPKPAGPHKAMQILYNQLNSQQPTDDMFVIVLQAGFTKNLKMDYDGAAWGGQQKVHGRTTPPLGWYDERAKARGEFRNRGFVFLAPRDNYGMVQGMTEYLDPAQWTSQKLYIPGLRRVRTLSSTDTQDVNPGSDSLFDDIMGFWQKMSPTIYPMDYKVIAEREYLVPAYSIEGREYFTSPEKGVERMNMEWERRPIYVVELTELDKTYVYSKRVLYIDRETFQLYVSQMYDRKGRLYRTFENMNQFVPDAGLLTQGKFQITTDHIDMHSSVNQAITYPDPSRMSRELGSIEALKLTK
jgi:hypothetical protein